MSDLKPIEQKGMKELAGQIDKLEADMLQHEQVDCPVIHRFGPGVYMREVKIPADTFSIGHHQNFEHMNIFLKGRVTMLNEDGSTSELKAPMMFVGKPGRKIGYIHEDMVWLNVYSTEEKDVEKLEAHYLTKSAAWGQSISAQDKIKLLKTNVDKTDYEDVVKDSGFTKEEIKAQVENTEDMIDLPYGNYKAKLGDSVIHGKGVFATADIVPGEIIGPSRIKGKRTNFGRFTNHSPNPNAEMIQGIDKQIYLAALAPINGCKGGLDGEEITINYRDALELTKKIGTGGFECQE